MLLNVPTAQSLRPRQAERSTAPWGGPPQSRLSGEPPKCSVSSAISIVTIATPGEGLQKTLSGPCHVPRPLTHQCPALPLPRTTPSTSSLSESNQEAKPNTHFSSKLLEMLHIKKY